PISGRIATCRIVNMEPEVESPKQFHKPLMDERLGNQYQCALNAAGQDQPVKNEARLDGFAQSDFVGEQDARRHAGGNFGSDVNLVGKEIDPAPEEAADFGLPPPVLMLECGDSKLKRLECIEMSGEEP